jgi:hypothetical protein
MNVAFGPCCFCGKGIERRKPDPCRVTVETAEAKPQVWFCHAECFRARLAVIPEAPGLFDPTHF